MITLLDVNVLVALFVADHLHHQTAWKWFERQAKIGWASCPITQNGCIRVVSGLPTRIAPSQIAEKLKQACDDPSHQFISDDLSILSEGKVRFNFVHGHRQITDVYLLALAANHDMALATFDRAIALNAVVGARAEHIVIPT